MDIRGKLLNRQPTIGTWIQIGHPAVAEVLGNLEFDWIAADCEHTEMSVGDFAAVARALHGRGPAPFIRVRENDTLAIRQALDVGACGVIVPLINSGAEAERAVSAAKFPPQGIRGFAYYRANEHGADFDAYVQRANDEIAVVAMVETAQAVENIDAILAVEGLDGVFIGPYDLSGSYGVPGATDHQLVRTAQRRVVEACRNAGKSAGLHIVVPSKASVAQAVETGFTFLAVGMDTVFLRAGGQEALGSFSVDS